MRRVVAILAALTLLTLPLVACGGGAQDEQQQQQQQQYQDSPAI